MHTVLAISGSLRKGSFNTALLRAAQELAPEELDIQIVTLEGIPVYNGDVETEKGIPPAVESLKNRLVEADALLIATPEYNNSIPGPVKNAIDWMSRPPKDIGKVFAGKPVGLMGASLNPKGTVLSQTAWLPVLRQLKMQYFSGKLLYVGPASELFNNNGHLVDEKTREKLAEYLKAFADFL
ncbi:MAG TPA: NADPH-dependent FMN reductase [Gammaproteobacteria bacterium]|nr:NADPH-dependent FMN reductase [Gammaproteobacteria bacterium]